MAVEDGATLGKLLGLLKSTWTHATHPPSHTLPTIPAVLALYERLRKKRTTLNVGGANENRILYHLSGDEAHQRDQQLRSLDWDTADNGCPWLWGDMSYMRYVNGFDTVEQADMAFHEAFAPPGALGEPDRAARERWRAATELEERLLEKLQTREKVTYITA